MKKLWFLSLLLMFGAIPSHAQIPSTCPQDAYYVCGPASLISPSFYPVISNNLGLSTSQNATALVPSTAPSGAWIVNGYVQTTQAGSGGTVTLTISWNNGASQSYTTSTASLSSNGANQPITLTLNSATSQEIDWSTTVSGASGSPQYAVFLTARYMGSTSPAPTFQGADAATNQTGTAISSLQTAGIATTTGWTAVVETRIGNGAAVASTPTVQGATATCTLASSSDSSSLDSGGSFLQFAVCPITAGNASTKVTCNFSTAIAYDSCVVLYFSGLTGTADTGAHSSAYANAATTNDLGSNTFTTSHTKTAVVACMTYNNSSETFSAGNIAGVSATLAKTSGSTNTGDTGCEYRILNGTVSAQQASLSIGGAESDLAVNLVAVY